MKKIEKSTNSQSENLLNLQKETVSILVDDSDQGGVRGVIRSNRLTTNCWYSRHNLPLTPNAANLACFGAATNPTAGPLFVTASNFSCVRTGFGENI